MHNFRLLNAVFKIAVVIILIPESGLCLSEDSDSTKNLSGFRGSGWGDNLEKIRSSEEAEYLQSFSGFGMEALSFRASIGELPTRIDYTFKEGKLVEGSYAVSSDDSFVHDFRYLKNFLTLEFGRPEFVSGNDYASDIPWQKENDYGLFRGPALYWTFANGFVALLSQKFNSSITVTVLYSARCRLEDYINLNAIPLEQFIHTPDDSK